jgi:hypothetical protein
MEYGFLFDKARGLLAIGYNVVEHRLDASCYDLLASEARATSFVAIAQGEAAAGELVRPGTPAHQRRRRAGLLSWSGSMFEYLMPLLVMPTYENTLLERTCHAAGAPADRLRPRVRRALGHVRVGLQHGRRRPQLPVPRFRRAGPRAQARA